MNLAAETATAGWAHSPNPSAVAGASASSTVRQWRPAGRGRRLAHRPGHRAHRSPSPSAVPLFGGLRRRRRRQPPHIIIKASGDAPSCAMTTAASASNPPAPTSTRAPKAPPSAPAPGQAGQLRARRAARRPQSQVDAHNAPIQAPFALVPAPCRSSTGATRLLRRMDDAATQSPRP
jgi:hypothetical protein